MLFEQLGLLVHLPCGANFLIELLEVSLKVRYVLLVHLNGLGMDILGDHFDVWLIDVIISRGD